MNKIARFMIRSKAATYIAALLCVVVWTLQLIEEGGGAHNYWALLIWAFAGYLAMKVERELSFNEARSSLPVTFFFMGCSMVPQVGLELDGILHFLMFPMACYVLLRTYRKRDAMAGYFLAFAIIGIQCLITPPLLLVLPWLVLCGFFMDSLHGRTIFASIWGLLLPFWVAFGVLLLTDRTMLAASYLNQIVPSAWEVPAWEQFTPQLLWVVLLIVPGGVMLLFNRVMRTQANVGYRLLMVALIVLLVAIAISPELYSKLSLCVLLYASLIGATMFVGNEDRARNIFLVALLVFWVASFGLYVWNACLRY